MAAKRKPADDEGYMDAYLSWAPTTASRVLWGFLLLAGIAGILAFWIVLSSVTDTGQRGRSDCNRHQYEIGLGLSHYVEAHGVLPLARVPNPALPREKQLSWMTQILLYIGEARPYQHVYAEKAWDDPANRPAFTWTPSIYQCPSQDHRVDEAGYGLTHYVGIGGVGPDGLDQPPASPTRGAFSDNGALSPEAIGDGAGQTLMTGEVLRPLGPWGAGGWPTARPYDPAARPVNADTPGNFGSPHAGGAHFVFADGRSHFLSETIDPSVFHALCTVNGGEVIQDKEY